MITVFTDGAGWNGTLSEFAFVIYSGDECMYEYHEEEYNERTNNEMEYKALISALEHLYEHYNVKTINRIVIRSDSQLVVNQVMGLWKINKENLKAYADKANEFMDEIPAPINLEWTRRHKNRAGIFIEKKQKERKKANAKIKKT